MKTAGMMSPPHTAAGPDRTAMQIMRQPIKVMTSMKMTAYMRMMTHMKIRRTACMSKIHGHPGARANGACLLLPRSARADASSPVPPPLLYVVLLLS